MNGDSEGGTDGPSFDSSRTVWDSWESTSLTEFSRTKWSGRTPVKSWSGKATFSSAISQNQVCLQVRMGITRSGQLRGCHAARERRERAEAAFARLRPIELSSTESPRIQPLPTLL